MKANAVSLLAVFEKKMRLEVPLFQRQYVWSQDQQWEPLWEDISRKFSQYLEGRKDAPVHFLGAMVLDQKQTPTTHVERRQIIDGQQRLTTLQIFLSVFRDFCREHDCEDLAKECESFTVNKGMMAEPEVDRFKVWPTKLDRKQFQDVVDAGSRSELIRRYPLQYRRYARKPEPRPRMIEAYLYFHEQLKDYFLGEGDSNLIAPDEPLERRLEECFQALKNALQVVAIDLEQDDDAQVIFETLNARGEPLLPADLLRNFIFLRAARRGESQESLYHEYWERFDDEFWRKEVKQGRLLRPRSDLFMQHFLASRQTVDIPIKHLFVEYKFWIEKHHPFATVKEELQTLARQGDDFRRILEPKSDDPLFRVVTFLDAFDIRTAYPLLLALLDMLVADDELIAIGRSIESYLVRRAICGLTTKNYNRTFLALTRGVRRDGATSQLIRKLLVEQQGESVEWPTDEAFREAWHVEHIYHVLNNPKVVYVLSEINAAYANRKMESIRLEGALTVEHIMPQKWIDNWPLPDGSKGLTLLEAINAKDDDSRKLATRKRDAIIQTLGNLTILSQPLNSAVSNAGWRVKKAELLRNSLLPINQVLHDVEVWDEEAISARADDMFEKAREIWSGR